MRKKLLISTDSFLPRWDGVARFLSEIIPLLKEKYDITVAAPKFEGKIHRIPGAKIVRIPLSGAKYGDYPPAKFQYQKINRLVMESDIIFNQTLGPIGFLAALSAKRHKKPVVSYIHSIEWELFPKAVKNFRPVVKAAAAIMARHAYNSCTTIIVPADETEEKMRANRIRTKAAAARLGTNTKKFKPAPSKEKAKTAAGISPKTKVIGYCGRIAREKGIPTLLKAFIKVNKEDPETMLLIVGSGVKDVEDMLRKSKNVIVTGSTDNVVPYLQAMDVYVLPSLTETTSISTLEAMSCGNPVIVTPVGYAQKYVKEGRNGMFFPKGNADALAKKIKILLGNEKMRKEMGAEARKTVEKDFRWADTAKAIIRVLDADLKNAKKQK